MLASELFALTQSRTCEGPDKCHWCGANCPKQWPHDDLPPLPFTKEKWHAKIPGSLYICQGCRLFRGGKTTVRYLDQTFRDGQSAIRNSWWITPNGAFTIGPKDSLELAKLLLKPPNTFCLMLLTETCPKCKGEGKSVIPRPEWVRIGGAINCEHCQGSGLSGPNHLHEAVVNDIAEIRKDTRLSFTVENRLLNYTIYELEEAIRRGGSGKAPGPQFLASLVGPKAKPLLPIPPQEKPGRGRKAIPFASSTVGLEVTMSGQPNQ